MNNKKLPWILVLSSMALLILFVSYWVGKSYKREENQLREDLKTQLQLAYTEVKDSDITEKLTYFFNPSSSDSLSSDSIKIQITDFRMTDDGKPTKLKFPEVTKKSEFRFQKPSKGASKDSLVNWLTNERNNSKTKSRVDTTTELFFEIHNDNDDALTLMTDENGKPKWITSDSIDCEEPFRFLKFEDIGEKDFSAEVILKNVLNDSGGRKEKTYILFGEKLVQNEFPTKFEIVNDTKRLPKGLRVEYKSNTFGINSWIVDMDNVRPYLLKKILPVFLFSLFLLGIVGLAFWTLMNNYIKQQQLVKVKSEFINNMTHELKTPLSTMAVALEAVSGFDLSKDAALTKEYIDISRHEVSRLSLLVDKVLNIAVFDREDTHIKMSKVDMEDVINDILKSMKLQFDNKNAEVSFLNTCSSCVIEGDAVHLTNVIYNIIDNALKYSKIQPQIDISIKDQRNNIMLSFEDNGIGIPKGYVDKVFDRFFRVPTDNQHDVKGHGLGLSYVRDVVIKHGGTIEVSSTIDKGTKFEITFPKSKQNA